MARRRWGSVVGAGLVALLACICAASGRSALPPIHEGGILRVNVSADVIPSLDPAVDYERAGWQILYATCAKLVNYPDVRSSAVGPVVPEVAAALPTVSDHGRLYTFAIRPGFRFNTGEAVTAASFANAINRDLAPSMRSPAAAFLRDVVGARDVLSGAAQTASGVVAEGDMLTVRLTQPAPDFVARMAMSFFCAVPAGLPAVPQGFTPIPSAGPYYVESATRHGSVDLAQNPYYGGSRPRHLDEITIALDTNQASSILDIEAGARDYEGGSLALPFVRERIALGLLHASQLSVHPDVETMYLVLNTRRPLFRTARMRRAVNFALDRRQILRATGLYGRPTDQILPPAMPGYVNWKIYPLGKPNLAQARRLAGTRHRVATFYVAPFPADETIAQVVAGNLRKIGIEVRIKEFKAPTGSLARVPFDITIADWIADYLDPYDFINVLFRGGKANTPASQNSEAYHDPRFDARMDAAAAMTGPARYAAYARLDADLMRVGAPIAPLLNVYRPELVSRRIRPDCTYFPPSPGGLDYATTCLR
jgi:peptide/nickel transport system substrate-binding protein